MYEHRQWLVEWFSKKYFVKKLVYFEQYTNIISAIQREKQIKWGSREYKVQLIEENNPEWKDLYNDIID